MTYPYQMTKGLPFFVYGTLRPGQGLSHAWIGDAIGEHDGAATVAGFALWAFPGSFPYAIPTGDPSDVAVGAIIRPVPGRYSDVLARLDRIEGYPSHYDRVEVTASTPDGPVQAWIYSPGDSTRSGLVRIPDGDWVAWDGGRRLRAVRS